MKKHVTLFVALLASAVLFSCKSKKMTIKNPAVIENNGREVVPSGTSTAANVTNTDRGLMMTFDSDVLFPTNSSYLTEQSKTALQEFVNLAASYPDAAIQVDGHTDATGTEEYNQWLSEKRAVSVKAYLETLGIAGSRISTKGYGQSQPIDSNKTKEGRQKNRRVEITILK